jgi:UDP-GlcNAc3NAcA epimerase
MIKLTTVIGARPQIIKAAAISRSIKKHFSGEIQEKILHTGQHYDKNMSQVFLEELNIPKPDFNLGVGSGSHGEQTAKMIAGIENILSSEQSNGIILYGDTNSTLAGAIAASKIHVPIFHIEAGLRSFNMAMPEEINRIVCDQLSSILFSPTETGVENLRREGFFQISPQFKNGKQRQIYNSGDIMYDNSLHFAQMSLEAEQILHDNDLEKNNYILATIHRDNNTDDKTRLDSIFKALLEISESKKIAIVLPLHPRTTKLLPINLNNETYQYLQNSKYIKLLPPASFLEMIALEKNSKIIMTDSGGVQKEAFFFSKPCIILRPETEWIEIIEHKAGILADADYYRIIEAYNELSNSEIQFPEIFGNGHASEFILDKIVKYFK